MSGGVHFECVQRQKSDAEIIFEWRTDPETMAMSLRKNVEDPEAFWSYFCHRCFLLKDLPPLFATIEGERVAFLSFVPWDRPHAPHRRVCEISIMVDPARRGKGIGSQVLEAVLPWIAQQGYEEVYAEVKPENPASKRIFEKAGFCSLGIFERNVEEWGRISTYTLEVYHYAFRLSSEPKPVFVIAEVGSNWILGDNKRNLQMAKTLIDAAKEAGCDAVKFQTFRPESLYVPNAGQSAYLAKAGIHEDIVSMFQGLVMPYEAIAELAHHAEAVGIEFMSTAFSPEGFYAVDPFVRRHKIASYEISHVHLLACAARSGKPLLLSTGASEPADIAWAVDYFRKEGGKEITLLHCCAEYPSEPKAMNLTAISWMQAHFQLPVGLSDHSRDPLAAPCAAVALGATVIEKHFTLDNRLPGPDHAFALTPPELKAMVAGIREVEAMRGCGVKRIEEEERELYAYARRRLQAIRPIQQGERLKEGENFAILRPGVQRPGLHPRFLFEVEGTHATRDIALGEGIQYGDWK